LTAKFAERRSLDVLYWLLGSSVRKIDNSNFHHPHIFLGHMVLNHQRNIEIFLRLWDSIPVASSSPHCEIPQKLQPHQITISTLSEVFLQNHASPSRQLTTRKPKSAMSWIFPQAQISAILWSN
jgi:hypothetical protein